MKSSRTAAITALLVCVVVLCALAISASAANLQILQVSFCKPTVASGTCYGGTIFVFVQNTGTTPQQITGVKLNNTAWVSGQYNWWKVSPLVIQPGKVGTVYISGSGSSGGHPTPDYVDEGLTGLSIEVDSATDSATVTGVTLTTQLLKVSNVIPSKDWKTLNVYLRNTDTANSYVINQVFINEVDVTSQTTFVGGGTTVPPASTSSVTGATSNLPVSVLLMKVAYSQPWNSIDDVAVRVIGTKNGVPFAQGGACRLVEPQFFIGNWSSGSQDWSYNYPTTPTGTTVTQRGARWGDGLGIEICNDLGLNEYGWHEWMCFHNRTISNRQDGSGDSTTLSIATCQQWGPMGNVYAWSMGDEPDNNSSIHAAQMLNIWNSAEANGIQCPLWLNMAQSTSAWNKYGFLEDIYTEDNYNYAGIVYNDYIRLNHEPGRTSAFSQGGGSSSTNSFAVHYQFWGQVAYGAKSVQWFTYGGNSTDNWFGKYPKACGGMQVASQEARQIRNLLLYGETSPNAAIVTSPTAGKGTVRLIVGEKQVVAIVLNQTGSASSCTASNGTITFTIPSWITLPLGQVSRVTQNGFVAVPVGSGFGATPAFSTYSVSGSTMTIGYSQPAFSTSATNGTAAFIFVIGAADTTPPEKVRHLVVAQPSDSQTLQTSDSTIAWQEPYDDVGISYYKIYRNGTYLTTSPYTYYEMVTGGFPDIYNTYYTVSAVDSAGNEGPQSLPVYLFKWKFRENNYPNTWQKGDFHDWCVRTEYSTLNWSYADVLDGQYLKLIASSGDPNLLGGYWYMLTGNYNYLHARMWNKSPMYASEFYFLKTTDAYNAGYSESGVSRIPIVPNDTQMRDYYFPLVNGNGYTNGWTGTVSKMRFDPIAGDANMSGEVDVDTLEFGKDVSIPTGSIVINGGAATTGSTNVTLTLSVTDPDTGGAFMRFSNDNSNWSAWQLYSTTASWTLPGLVGSQTVYAQFMDGGGNVSAIYSASIIAAVPVASNLAVSPNPDVTMAPITVTWDSVRTDHCLLQVDSGAVVNPATSPYTINPLILSYGSHTVSVTPADSSGTLGAKISTTFTLDRSIEAWNIIGSYPWDWGTAPDPTRFSNDFFTPAATELTVYAKTGLSYASTVQPAAQGTGTCNTAWTPYTCSYWTVDLNNVYNTPSTYTQYGVSYLFTYVINSGAAIPNAYVTCGSDDGIKIFFNGAYIGGNDVYRGCTPNSDLYGPFTINPGANRLLVKITQGTLGYQAQAQLCNADRTELAAVTSGQITYAVSDDNAPTGTIAVTNGPFTTGAANLALTASDDLSGVATMSFSDDGGTTWSSPGPFAPTKVWTLSPGDGPRTVAVKFTDRVGNTSSPISAGITLDTTPPSTPSVTVTPSVTSGTASATFSATDATSGVASYQLKVDGGSYAPATSPMAISGLADGSHTVSVIATDSAGNVSAAGSATFTVDTVAPTATLTLAAEKVGASGAFIKGGLTANIAAADTGGSGVATVEVKVDDGTYAPATVSGTGWTFACDPITATTANGSHTCYARVTDNAGNQTTVTQGFTVNKNEVSGTIRLQGLTNAPVTRDVTFVLNGNTALTQTVSLSFTNGVASFSFTDVPEVTAISAKTAWNVRSKISDISPDNGQSTAFFTSAKALLGGDLSGDNVVNTIDYVMLRNAWGASSVGDINGDGVTDNSDYAVMKGNMYKKGDPQ